jgi:dihydroxyacetone kinase-like predicted kinase
MRSLFRSLGAVVVDGGPTLNPPTKDLLTAIESCPAAEVVVLPNSTNVQMAAEEAARLAAKTNRKVVVVPSESQQGALAALVEFDPADDAEANAERLRSGLAGIRVGAVAPAARDDADGRFRRGDSVGFADGELVAWGGAGTTLIDTVAALVDGAEIVTVIEGAEAPVPLAELELELPNGAELELQRGGTPNYSWLIATQ